MKVLLSAYACHPAAGSEPGVGFQTLMAVAERHEVWVLTRQKNARALADHLKDHPLLTRIHVVPLDLSRSALRMKGLFGGLGTQLYYDRWQAQASALGRRLHWEIGFDVAHHVTFSADWSRAGVATLGVPFVWGPIGGGVVAPFSLLSGMGWRGILGEIARQTGRAVLRRRRWYREAWRRARVILVQNDETAGLGTDRLKTRLLPNSTAIDLPVVDSGGPRSREILVVGRLIPWKGGMLALRAFCRIKNPEADLVFLGGGPEHARLERAARRLGIATRVKFGGSLSRDDVLRRVAHAGVVLHLAVHEENSMAVGEALSLGTPVVCLDWGGPPELLRQWSASPGAAVHVGTIGATAKAVAMAIDEFLDQPPPIPDSPIPPKTSYGATLLQLYEEAKVSETSVIGRESQPGL